ncbi:acetoacetate-CoA ligase [Violaceomyces palustris]|uniref:Acetoacetate-CoA ligase n=1 Tax=Violaceomyces palustris TaxID=1673888 RepID=A0ACD0P8C6_9BASI|nr:acetoacetate-CoA ligase [Violaceomyces palustris]
MASHKKSHQELYPLVWKAEVEAIESSPYTRFRKMVNLKYGLNIETYDQLHSFSINEVEKFWETVWDWSGIRASRKFDKVLTDHTALPADLPSWFPGASFSMAENVLFPQHPFNATACSRSAPYHWPPANANAIIEIPEGGGLSDSPPELKARFVTWGELRNRVAILAQALRNKGIKKGDRIAHVSANTSDPIVAMLAANSIGAIFSLMATDAGPQAILGRLQQIRPKLIFTDDQARYNGKTVNIVDRVARVAETLLSEGKVEDQKMFEVVIIKNRRITTPVAWKSSRVRGVDFDSFIASAGLNASSRPAHNFEQLPANHPVQIFFSSGTTGEPKCIVHSQCMLPNFKKEALLQFQVRPGDRFFQITTCGWVMWSAHILNMASGVTAVAYDGSPLYPTPEHLVKIVAEHRLTGFGGSPRYLSELEKSIKASENPNLIKELDLSDMRYMTSTGSPLSSNNVAFFYNNFPKRIHLCSITGGTDLCGCIAAGAIALPLHGHLIQSKTLGIDLRIWDAVTGEDIEASGESGELVIASSFPTQPLYFFGPEDQKQKLHEKYMDSYYNRFEGKRVWAQGDFISRDPITGGFEIHGRSDGVLNPSGVRFGSAEIYSVVEPFPFVADSVVVGQRRPGRDEHERVLLFIKVRDPVNSPLTEVQKQEIKSAIRQAYTPRHVPEHIFQVQDIPLTLNGKKTELAVKAVVCGDTRFKPSSATANPEALDEYRKYADLERVLEEKGSKLTKAKL